MTPEALVAMVLAPFVVLPACHLGAAAVRFVRRCHAACTWPERLTIAGFLLGALCHLALVLR